MTYRISALGAAARGMWRGWTVLVPVVVVNAALQALLVWPSVTIDASAMLVALAVASYVVLLVAAGLVVAVALDVPDGRVGWRPVLVRLRVRAVPFACWTTAFAVVAAAAWAFSVVPGALVLAVGVYVPFAALDGRGPTLRVAWEAVLAVAADVRGRRRARVRRPRRRGVHDVLPARIVRLGPGVARRRAGRGVGRGGVGAGLPRRC